ncbi:MAG: glycosyltransferase [Bacteroidaceae bacterium]|nr:glycosyltransferase [Bacteroidaceae bacterium]
MKIIEYIPQLGSGGGERFTVDLCNELSKHHEVILCLSHSLEKYGFYKEEISPRVRVINFNKRNGFDWRLPFRVYKLIRKERPDVVHTHLMSVVYTALSAFLLRKPKYFHTVHNTAKVETDGRIGEKVRRFLFSKRLVTPVTISEDTLRCFKEFYNIDAPLINNGRDIPADLIVTNEVKEEFEKYRRTSHTRVIVQLAHVGHQKRQDVMARVADRLMKEGYDFTVLMIGEINERQMVDNIKALNNPKIHLLGGKHNPLEYLKAADAFALTSSFEGLPISLIESMGVGLVPICTPVGGIVNLISDEVNGFLSSDITEESYYTALKRYLDTPTEYLLKMKAEALKTYQPFTMTECARNYEQIFSMKVKN